MTNRTLQWRAIITMLVALFCTPVSAAGPSRPGPIFPCNAPLPALPSIAFKNRPEFQRAVKEIDTILTNATASPNLNSLVIAIVTPSGIAFEKGYGVARINETTGAKPDSNTIYRIASISKMFTALETLILRDKGALNWDDPVKRFFPNFSYPSTGWKERYDGTESFDNPDPVTLRQLSSHMAGIAREAGAADIPTWPIISPGIPIPRFPSRDEILARIATHPLALPPYTFPAYSNAGFSLLGWCNVIANSQHAAATGGATQQPATHADLLYRDVFEPLGMKDSFFNPPDGERASRVAVSILPYEADLDFGELNPEGGQYGTINDLAILLQSLLDPSRPKRVIRASTVREWLRPLHGWYDQFTEVGAPWEITKYLDSYGRPQRFFEKSGALNSYQSLFSFNPSSSFGIITLATGLSGLAYDIVGEAIGLLQPAFDRILEAEVKKKYGGTWSSTDKKSHVTLSILDGSLWITKYDINGTDILGMLQLTRDGKPAAPAWWTGRPGEFRAIPVSVDSVGTRGCSAYWGGISAVNSRDAPIDLLYFSEGSASRNETVLHIPSVEVSLTRG